jgi:hypothetical protein
LQVKAEQGKLKGWTILSEEDGVPQIFFILHSATDALSKKYFQSLRPADTMCSSFGCFALTESHFYGKS